MWDLGALLPAIASLSQGLPAPHAVGKKQTHSNSFQILQVLHEDDANRIKVLAVSQLCPTALPCKLWNQVAGEWQAAGADSVTS